MNPNHREIILFVILTGLLGCVKYPEVPPSRIEKPPPAEINLVKLNEGLLKGLSFEDDGDSRSFVKAAMESIAYFERFPATKIFKTGQVEFSAHHYAKILRHLTEVAEKRPISREDILSVFDVYVYKTADGLETNGNGRILATGYYEPILEGSLKPSGEYRYPIYPVPEDLVRVSLEAFNLNCGDVSSIVGRLEGRKLVPYYTRREIDEGALKGISPLVWVKNPVDAFFLQVQGSGIIRFPDGSKRRLGYGSGNGRPYRSIGKYMIDQGWMSKDEVSMQAIKAYLNSHPDKLWTTLWYNENYVFFRWVEEGPKGSLDVFLIPERSVASDRRYYPPGVLSFVSTVAPENSSGLRLFNRWIFHHDAGGAIKGPSRIDIFFGSGDEAGEKAGRMKHKGTIFLFLPKQ